MRKQQIVIFAKFVVALGSIPILAGFFQQPNFNVKTGLWESTVVTHTTGAPPIPDDMMARLSPEQQQKMAAAMQASRARAAQPHTTRTCLTRDKMDRGFQHETERPECKPSVVTNTPTILELREECSSSMGSRVVTLHYQAINPESVTGTIHMEMTGGGKTMVSDGTMQGKWISDSCGDVK
jgi:hypothetical protein